MGLGGGGAAKWSQREIVQILISKKPKVNTADKVSVPTCVHVCVCKGLGGGAARSQRVHSDVDQLGV